MAETTDVLLIRMQSGDVECSLCRALTDFGWSVPTYNGDVVSNDFPDDLHALGGSVPVCERCYERHAAGQVETFDRYYVRPGADLIGGAGI